MVPYETEAALQKHNKTPLLNFPCLSVDFTLACFLPSEHTWKLILLVLLEFMLCLWMAWIEHDVGVLFFLPYGWIVEFKYLHANPISKIIRTYAHLWGMTMPKQREQYVNTGKMSHGISSGGAWHVRSAGASKNYYKMPCMGKQFTTKWWDTHYDLKASWRLQNSMHHTILTRHILTKITTYRGLKDRHFVEVIGRGILW